MKRNKTLIYGIVAGALALMLMLGGAYAVQAASESPIASTVQQPDPGVPGTPGGEMDLPPAGTVDDQEIEDLLWMREEEKLARDVYLTLAEQWDVAVFTNISQSEQQHMDAVAVLLERYGLEDPVGENGVGEFTNPELQALYDELVAQGSQSLADALTVGATIEDVDILDLEEAMARTDNADIQQVYSSLECGSENHLRAFVSTLEQMTGESYTPQFIDQATYDAILAGNTDCAQQGQQGGHGNQGGQGSAPRGPRH